jgi:hypothetical protein
VAVAVRRLHLPAPAGRQRRATSPSTIHPRRRQRRLQQRRQCHPAPPCTMQGGAVRLVCAVAVVAVVVDAAAPTLCDADAGTPAQVQATCDNFCAGKCAFNTPADTGTTTTLTVYRETPHNMTDLAEKDCGDVYGDVSFYLANHNIPYECHLNPKADSCTSHNAIELNSQGNIFVEYVVEVDGGFGPYQMCNPLNGWDTKHWSCLTYCEQPPACAPWKSQKAQLGWMGPTCFCENGRSNRTVGRSLRSASHHGHHHPNPPSWPATCGKAGYNDISSMGYELNGTVYKTLTGVDAGECCDACNAEPGGKCVGWVMPGDGKRKADCRLSMEPSDWVSTGGANVTSGGRFHHGAGHISDGVLGGYWLSMPAQGECKGGGKPGDGSGCTWRTVRSGKQVNASCATQGVDRAIVANQPECFANCSEPTNTLSECYTLCFAQALQGNTTLGWAPMDRDAVVAPFLAAFASEDATKGGCKDLRKAAARTLD